MKKRCMISVVMILAAVWLPVKVNAGLLSHYSFDIADAGITPDSVGSAYADLGSRVAINTSAGQARVGIGALEMMGGGDTDGPSDGAVTSNSFSWTNDVRTVTFWWRAKSTDLTKNGSFVSFGTNDAHGTRMDIKQQQWSSAKKGSFRVEVDGAGQTSNPLINDGQWHFIAVVVPKDGAIFADIELYVDGGAADLNSSSSTLAIATGTGALAFGDSIVYAGDGRVPNGFLDEFQLYDEALTQDQLAYMYDNPGAVVPGPATIVLLLAGALGFVHQRQNTWKPSANLIFNRKAGLSK